MVFTDEICISLLYNGERQLPLNRKKIVFNEYPGIEEYLEKRYNDSSCIEETLYRMKNKIEVRPLCQVCQNPVNFSKNEKTFRTYCSSKCQNSDPEKQKKSNETKMLRYGDKNYNNFQKALETNKKRYGVEFYTQTKSFVENQKKRNQEKYGCDWALQSEDVKKKGKVTKLLKYGDENYNNREKSEKTSLAKYGVRNTKQAETAKQKEKETCLEKYGVTSYSKTKECKEKHIQTFLKNYGVTHNTKSQEWKEKWYGNEEWTKKRNIRIYNSMKENGSFKESKTENIIYEIILKKYPDVIREFKDETRYPFKCDFYIPSIDVFIEYDGYWTHGGHDFNPDDEKDINKLKIWELKSNKQYATAIKVWTVDDPLKRKYAKEHNLKYIVLKYEDFKSPEKILEKIDSLV